MKNIITQFFCSALVFGTLTVAGCGGEGAGGIHAGTAEEQAAIKAKSAEVQAEYAKSMAESQGK